MYVSSVMEAEKTTSDDSAAAVYKIYSWPGQHIGRCFEYSQRFFKCRITSVNIMLRNNYKTIPIHLVYDYIIILYWKFKLEQ